MNDNAIKQLGMQPGCVHSAKFPISQIVILSISIRCALQHYFTWDWSSK